MSGLVLPVHSAATLIIVLQSSASAKEQGRCEGTGRISPVLTSGTTQPESFHLFCCFHERTKRVKSVLYLLDLRLCVVVLVTAQPPVVTTPRAFHLTAALYSADW